MEHLKAPLLRRSAAHRAASLLRVSRVAFAGKHTTGAKTKRVGLQAWYRVSAALFSAGDQFSAVNIACHDLVRPRTAL